MPNNSIALNQNAGALSSADFNKSPSNNQEVLAQFEQERERNRKQLEQMLESELSISEDSLRQCVFQNFYKAKCLSSFNNSDSLFSYYQLSTLLQVSKSNLEIHEVKTTGEFEIEFETGFILEFTVDYESDCQIDCHLLKVIYNPELDLYSFELTYKETGIVIAMPQANLNDFDKIMDIITVQAEAKLNQFLASLAQEEASRLD